MDEHIRLSCCSIQCACNIFMKCISENEVKFIKVVNQITLIRLFEKLDYFIDHLVPCDVCGGKVVTNVM